MNVELPLAINSQSSAALADETYCPECGKPFCEPLLDCSRQTTPFPTGPMLLTVIGILLITLFGWRTIATWQARENLQEQLVEPAWCVMDDPTSARCDEIYSRRAAEKVQPIETSLQRDIDQSLVAVAVGAVALFVGIGEMLFRPRPNASAPSMAWEITNPWLDAIFRVLLILLGLAVVAQLLHGDVVPGTLLSGAVAHVSDALLEAGSSLVG